MAETFSMDLSPGGGGGIDFPLKPVAEDDFEPDRDPSPEVVRELLGRSTMHNVVQFGSPREMGSLPPTLSELYTYRSRSDTLPTKLGSLSLGGIHVNIEGQSFN
jgi:NAD(P)H-dependent FMN reductase